MSIWRWFLEAIESFNCRYTGIVMSIYIHLYIYILLGDTEVALSTYITAEGSLSKACILCSQTVCDLNNIYHYTDRTFSITVKSGSFPYILHLLRTIKYDLLLWCCYSIQGLWVHNQHTEKSLISPSFASDDRSRSQMYTYHANVAVITCVNLWPVWIITFT